MTRPSFLRLEILLFLVLAASARVGAEGRPNILFILTDDQGWPT